MLEQLKADWGKTDSPWDLNDDGIVDVRDFLKMLTKMRGGAHDAVPPAVTEVDPNAEVTAKHVDDEQPDNKTWVDQLRADWGKTDSPWDLNDDGIVNVRDFLKMLAKISSGAHDGNEQPGNRTWVEQLRADWGKTDSLWDLNGDGTVNVRDFLKVLAMMRGDPQPSDTPREPVVERVSHVMRRAQAAYAPATATEPARTARGLDFKAVG
jgi:Ca2+-binding EF-hand superfamily protein